MIEEGIFYKAAQVVGGNIAPGGFLYVYSAADPVTFGVAPLPDKKALTGNTFKLPLEDFLKIVGYEATT